MKINWKSPKVLIGGGVAVVLIGIGMAMAGPPPEDEYTYQDPFEETASAPETSTPPAADPTTEPPAAEPTKDDTETEEPKQSAQDWADGIRDDMLEANGVTDFADTCDFAQILCSTVNVRANAVGTVYFTVQETDWDKERAKSLGLLVFNTIGKDHPELSYVVVEGADEVVIGQLSRSDVPLLR